MRIPGALGNAMGIVGGLIVGSAAVEANLVSPDRGHGCGNNCTWFSGNPK